MKLIKNLEQQSEEWHEFRAKHLGASEISYVMGQNPYKSAYRFWLEKTGQVERDKPNKAMQRGTEMEEEARNRFIHISETFYEPCVGESTKWKVASASFDGISEDGDYILEIKVPGEKMYNQMFKDHMPRMYFLQCQWQLMVSGAKKCTFFVYKSEHENYSYEVFPDKKLHSEMLGYAMLFWDMVLFYEIVPESIRRPALVEGDHLLIKDAKTASLVKKYYEADILEKDSKATKLAVKETLEEVYKDVSIECEGLKITTGIPKVTTDWKKLCSDFGITEEELQTYQTKTMNSRVTIKR